MKFRYRRFTMTLDGAAGSSHTVYRPVAPIEILGDRNSLKLFALIDTGADFTLLPMEVAKFLGIPLAAGSSVSMTGVGGSTIQAYPATVDLTLTQGRESLRWHARVHFAEQDNLLLGNEGFLEFFIATFDWAAKTIDLAPNSMLQRSA